jgi:hypothetical protein
MIGATFDLELKRKKINGAHQSGSTPKIQENAIPKTTQDNLFRTPRNKREAAHPLLVGEMEGKKLDQKLFTPVKHGTPTDALRVIHNKGCVLLKVLEELGPTFRSQRLKVVQAMEKVLNDVWTTVTPELRSRHVESASSDWFDARSLLDILTPNRFADLNDEVASSEDNQAEHTSEYVREETGEKSKNNSALLGKLWEGDTPTKIPQQVVMVGEIEAVLVKLQVVIMYTPNRLSRNALGRDWVHPTPRGRRNRSLLLGQRIQ